MKIKTPKRNIDKKTQQNQTKPKKKKLTETSTTRVWKHLIATNPKELVIMSAFRTEYSKQENLQRMNELEKDVKNLGYGFIHCIGFWINPKDTNDKSQEISLMIPNMTWREGVELGKKYEQYSIIAKNGDKIAMINCSNEECETTFDQIHNKLNINDAKKLVDNFDNPSQLKIHKDIKGATIPRGTKRPFAFRKNPAKRFDSID